MKVELKFSIMKEDEIIDLEDWGYDENKKWSDLTEDEKNEIRDNASQEIIVEVVGEDIND